MNRLSKIATTFTPIKKIERYGHSYLIEVESNGDNICKITKTQDILQNVEENIYYMSKEKCIEMFELSPADLLAKPTITLQLQVEKD